MSHVTEFRRDPNGLITLPALTVGDVLNVSESPESFTSRRRRSLTNQARSSSESRSEAACSVLQNSCFGFHHSQIRAVRVRHLDVFLSTNSREASNVRNARHHETHRPPLPPQAARQRSSSEAANSHFSNLCSHGRMLAVAPSPTLSLTM